MKRFFLIPVLLFTVEQTSLASRNYTPAEVATARCYIDAFSETFNYKPYTSTNGNPTIWYRSGLESYASDASHAELNRQSPEYSASVYLGFSSHYSYSYSSLADGRSVEIDIITPEIGGAILDELPIEFFPESFAQVSYKEGASSKNYANFEIRVPVVIGKHKQVCTVEFDNLGNAEKVCNSGFGSPMLLKLSSQSLPDFPLGSVRNKNTKKLLNQFKLNYNSLEKCLEQAVSVP